MNVKPNTAKIPLLLTHRIDDSQKNFVNFEKVEYTHIIGQDARINERPSFNFQSSFINNQHDFEYQE